jgi:hypothetical protein
MASEKVEIQFVADSQGAEQAAKNIDKSLDDISTTAKQASGGISTFFGTFAGAFGAGLALEAIRGVASALTSLPDIIARGAQIDDIAASFENLADKAGASGDVLLSKFSAALGDTIPKVDLMKQANELLNGNIDPTKFEELAGAARSLAEVTGGSAKDGLETLSDALLRGRTMGLKAIGVIVDNAAAVEDYAKSLGVAKEALGAEDQIEAIRIATLDQLAKKRAELAIVEDDAADIIDQVKTNIQNQTDEILKNIANNSVLIEVLKGVRDGFEGLKTNEVLQDLIDIASAVLGLATGLGTLTTQVANLVAKGIELTPLVRQTIDGFRELRDLIGKGALIANYFGGDKEKADAKVILDLLKQNGVELDKNAKSGKDNNSVLKDGAEAQEKVAKATADTVERIKKANEEILKKKEAEKAAAEAVRASGRAEDERKKIADQYSEALKKQRQEILQAVTKSKEYERILLDLKAGLISNAQAGDEIKNLYSETEENLRDLAVATKVYDSLLEAQSKGLNVSSEDLGRYASEIENLESKLADAAKTSKDIKSDGGLLEGILGGLLPGAGETGGFEEAGKVLGQGLLNGLSAALRGDKLSKEETGAAVGEGIGAGIGAYFGDPQTGALLGNAAGAFLANAFGSRNAQGAVRDALDRSFADALKENPLQINIDGSGVKITDLNFFKGTDAFSTGEFDDFFQSLDATSRESFQGLATGFSEAFGQGSELAGQLAAILATNLGGSLNNLQLLVQSTGKSFEELKGAVVEAFLDGKLSALEAQSAINGIARAAQDGIPDGIGLVKEAFDNIAAAGVKGGRTLIDALKDVGFEAKELGDKTLQQVMTRLKNTAGVSAEEVDKVFNALNKAGITTLDQLTSATNEGLIPALADLEQQKFPFAQAAKDAKDYLLLVDSIPEQKDIQINLKVNYQNSADEKVIQNLSSGRGPGSATV